MVNVSVTKAGQDRTAQSTRARMIASPRREMVCVTRKTGAACARPTGQAKTAPWHSAPMTAPATGPAWMAFANVMRTGPAFPAPRSCVSAGALDMARAMARMESASASLGSWATNVSGEPRASCPACMGRV